MHAKCMQLIFKNMANCAMTILFCCSNPLVKQEAVFMDNSKRPS